MGVDTPARSCRFPRRRRTWLLVLSRPNQRPSSLLSSVVSPMFCLHRKNAPAAARRPLLKSSTDLIWNPDHREKKANASQQQKRSDDEEQASLNPPYPFHPMQLVSSTIVAGHQDGQRRGTVTRPPLSCTPFCRRKRARRRELKRRLFLFSLVSWPEQASPLLRVLTASTGSDSPKSRKKISAHLLRVHWSVSFWRSDPRTSAFVIGSPRGGGGGVTAKSKSVFCISISCLLSTMYTLPSLNMGFPVFRPHRDSSRRDVLFLLLCYGSMV